ncbi:MAG: response regulator, partial [Desulfobulbaceae bacterium]|nr:response regulator [Desulfobulbaceae bacterium]
ATANQMIEERQKFQSDLQQSKEVWERSFNAISDLVTIHDKNSRIIRVNQAACNFLNKKPEEIIGKHCYEVFQQSAEQCQNCPGNKTLLDKLSHTETIPFLPQKKTFQISTAPTFDDNGQLEYVVHVAKDISEQKQLEEELVQSQKMEAIGTLAGGIAHDFNNILTSLLGYADLAKEEAGDDNHQAHYIGQVITAGNRASALVKQILAFSRKSEVSREHISAEQIINESLKLLRASIPSTIKINTQITPTEDTIFADPAKIHQIMVNLCTNAQHAIGEQQGIITINLSSKNLTQDEIPDQSGTEPGTFLELTVTDTGHGISSDIIDHIFDPYFTTKEVGKGIGMGLAVIHGIVKELGGIIKVESKAKEGASFHVFLPAAPRDDQEASTSAPKSPPRNGNERILVVDDEEDISFMLKGGLERFGYRVSARTNSAEALAEFASSPNDFNLIITDQTMPDMTGTAMAKEVLKLRPDMPIILYSGYSDLVAGKAAKDIGIRKFLLKPIDSKTMAEHIRKILDENQTVTGKA